MYLVNIIVKPTPVNIFVKPTNSPTQDQPDPRKNRLKVAFWTTFFPQQIIFRGLGLVLYRKQTTRNLTQPISQETAYYHHRVCDCRGVCYLTYRRWYAPCTGAPQLGGVLTRGCANGIDRLLRSGPDCRGVGKEGVWYGINDCYGVWTDPCQIAGGVLTSVLTHVRLWSESVFFFFHSHVMPVMVRHKFETWGW